MIAFLLLACETPIAETGEPSDDSAFTVEECDAVSGHICTFAGTGIPALGKNDISALESHLYLPQDLTFGPDGGAYLEDWNNHRIRRVDPDGTVDTVAGIGFLGDGPEGPALDAAFNHPSNIAFSADGVLYLAAWHNSRVERIDLSTGALTFVAGDGSRSYAGDGGDAKLAKLDLPSSVAFGSDGTLYISDMANWRIRSVDGLGIINSYAGTGVSGFSGDGGLASLAQLAGIKGQAAAPANRIAIAGEKMYVADTGNQRIRVIDMTSGIITTLAGDGTAGYSGDGGSALEARIFSPADVAVGPEGEVYVADTENSCIRVIDTSGNIDTFAGICGVPGFDGNGGLAADATLNKPYGVSADAAGNVYIGDTFNQVFRVVYK